MNSCLHRIEKCNLINSISSYWFWSYQVFFCWRNVWIELCIGFNEMVHHKYFDKWKKKSRIINALIPVYVIKNSVNKFWKICTWPSLLLDATFNFILSWYLLEFKFLILSSMILFCLQCLRRTVCIGASNLAWSLLNTYSIIHREITPLQFIELLPISPSLRFLFRGISNLSFEHHPFEEYRLPMWNK